VRFVVDFVARYAFALVVEKEFARKYVESRLSRRSALKFEPEPEKEVLEMVSTPPTFERPVPRSEVKVEAPTLRPPLNV
jgi:hypothetical protein